MFNISLNTKPSRIKGALGYFLIVGGIWFATFQDKFLGFLSPRTITYWDTHAYGFIYFLYFSDALREGSIALWNPFVQSGMFFPNFFNTGLFYPFELIFVFLGWVIGPIISFELMIQSVIAIGGIGAYFLFRYWKIDSFLALFGSLLYVIIILCPIVGQIWYTVSFSSLPWLICICSYLCDKKNDCSYSQWMLWAILYVFFIAGGYLWLNLMNLLLAFSFTCIKLINSNKKNSPGIYFSLRQILSPPFLFLGLVALLYACMMLPCFLNIQFNYSNFWGDFVSPDGRLRGLAVGGGGGHSGALETLIGNLDPLISQNQPWWREGVFSYGGGWTLWILFVISLFLVWTKRQIFWLLLLILGILYSAGSQTLLGSILVKIPIINGNRYWIGVGASYAAVFLLFIVIDKCKLIKNELPIQGALLVRLAITALLSIAFLYYMYAPSIEFFMAGLSCLLIAGFCIWKLSLLGRIALIFLIILNVFFILNSPYRSYSNLILDNAYLGRINHRNKDIVITSNQRKLDSAKELNSSDTEWVYKKIPFAHGYNHLGNPIYWYVKNNPLLEKIVVVTQSARPEAGVKRSSYKNDNEYAESVGADVLANHFAPTINRGRFVPISPSPQFNYEITQLQINPNSVSFDIKTNDSAHIIINMLSAPGWKLLVDGVERQPYQANYVFSGFDLTMPGVHHIKFYYRPYGEIVFLLVPYITLLGLVFARLLGRKN